MPVSPLTKDDPDELGPYQLLGRLGSGGMGTVYLARSGGGRTVALKTMHACLGADLEFRRRFRLEIDAARVLGGRYGAAVVDADPHADTPWLATDYVIGPPLDNAVERHGNLPEACTRALGGELCAALKQLHGSGVVHRDLKPSNILLTVHGPKVIDFGIARAVGDTRLTRPGAAAGTPAFMSPEQATGGEHGPPGDVFAIAGVLVFTLTGRGPFGGGQTADLLYRVRYADPDLTDVPHGLVDLLSHCFEKEPEKRPSVERLSEALQEATRSETSDDESDGRKELFAALLPEPVLHDIALRCEEACGPAPERAVPSTNEQLGTEGGVSEAGLGRRRMLALSAAGAAALAGVAYVAHTLLDDGTEARDQGKAADGASPSARPPGTPPRPVWRQSIPEAGPEAAPSAVGDAVIVPTRRGLVGLDAKGGKELWMLEGITEASQLALDGRRLFVPRDAAAGELQVAQVDFHGGAFERTVVKDKQFQASGAMLLAARDNGLYLIAQLSDSDPTAHEGWRLLRYDISSGKERWRRRLAAQWTPDTATKGVAAALSGKFLILLRDGRAGVVDTQNGRTLWEKKIPTEKRERDNGPRPGQLAYSSAHLFVGSNEVLALRLRDGHVSWRFGKDRSDKRGKGFEEGEDRRYGPPTLKDDVIYAMEGMRGWVALDAQDGRLLWEEKETGQPAEMYSAPVVGKKNVYGTVDSSRFVSAVGRRSHSAAWTLSGTRPRGLGRAIAVHPGRKLVVALTGSTVIALPLE
ncbi:serine/threonine-protein kinase [Streptomyces sp. 891-h]|uniref:serine/threonine-protein kinase n=1 Tax=Streptomyces sp. 891-h TaxID=2720714 RepID=UPI001FAB08B1|nr:serine/threonine-protein kinase [Streptomyces sp. 891-h]UNZ17055.1 PQQ-binding-like beta-propeller repeat protein [Streptomyces sp. 891-h]